MERIVGLVFSGFAVKIYAIGLALWMVSEVASIVIRTFGVASNAF